MKKIKKDKKNIKHCYVCPDCKTTLFTEKDINVKCVKCNSKLDKLI